MATTKPKKRKFFYPGMLIAETDSDSTNDSDENQSQTKKKSVHPQRFIVESSDSDQENQIGAETLAQQPSSPIAGPSNQPKKRKKIYPGMLIEETESEGTDDSDNNQPQTKSKTSVDQRLIAESSDSDLENQIGGEESSQQPSSPIAEPSSPISRPSSPIAGPSSPIAGPSNQQLPSTLNDANWFEEETKIFENDDFILVIQKQDHQRQKVFRLEDHLFVMRIKLKNHKKPPFLSSIRDIIEHAMTVMVNDLKNHYNPNESNLIYVTIRQPGMLNALRSGGFNLQISQTTDVLSFVMNMFNRFINSNEELRLDQGFQVYFKIFSYNHVNWPKTRKNQNQRTLGCHEANQNIKIAGCVQIPNGFPGKECAFENKCLLTSTIVCSYANKYFQNNKADESFEKLMPLWTNRASKKKKIEAGKFLETEIQKIIDNLELQNDGPYDISSTMPKLCAYFSSQIHVIKSTQEFLANIESFPTPEWKNDLLQIFLFQSNPGHVVPIVNLKQYTNQNNQICLICMKTFQRYYRHVCSFRDRSCFLCKSYYAQASTIFQPNLPFTYCLSKLHTKLPNPIVCEICNYKFQTEQCFQNHKTICGVKSKKGKIGFFCDPCNKFIKGTDTSGTKRNHKCFQSSQRKCHHCQEIFEQTDVHHCRLTKENLTRIWPKLIFFSFEFQSNSTFQCTSCQLLRRAFKENQGLSWKEACAQKEFGNLKCVYHEKTTLIHSPNYCTIWKETTCGSFQEICLADDALNLKNEVNPNLFHFNYDVDGKNPSAEQRPMGKQTEATKASLKKIMDQKNKSVMDYFLIFLLSADVKNYTFLSLNNCNENISTAMDCLLKLNWAPTIVKKGNTFVLLKTKCQNLMFINASNYFKGTYLDLVQQFCLDESAHFFPQR